MVGSSGLGTDGRLRPNGRLMPATTLLLLPLLPLLLPLLPLPLLLLLLATPMTAPRAPSAGGAKDSHSLPKASNVLSSVPDEGGNQRSFEVIRDH